MYFYLSFLRPPPTSVSTSGTVSFTPQIANDLRTELYPHPQDIYYSWVQVFESSNPINWGVVVTKPTKITTWRPSNAYKELQIHPPAASRDAQSWRLMLSAESSPTIQKSVTPSYGQIDLESDGLGSKLPFSVLSMPIRLDSRSAKAATKQEQIERLFRLPLLQLSTTVRQTDAPDSVTSEQSAQCILKITERTSFDLDKKVWDSGVGLSSWLVRLASKDPAFPLARDLRHSLHDILYSAERPTNVLELGAGTGIVSLTLAAMRSRVGTGGKLLTTDLPFLPEAVVLDWDKNALPESVLALDGLDLIIMADVTYNTASFPVLVNTISNLVQHSGSSTRSPLLVMGYKQRDPSERELWDMLYKEVGTELEKVDECAGAGDAAVEIWIAKLGTTTSCP